MSARVNNILRIWIRIAAAAFLMLAVAFDAYAAESIPVLEQHVSEDTAYLYLRHAGSGQTAEAQIGTDAAGRVAITDRDSVPVVTWLVLDNSISIGSDDRSKAKELFTNLVAGKSANESFSLCTYEKQINILVQDSQSYADLKKGIDSIEHHDQVSYLTDVIAEILDIENSRKDLVYARIVVVCDGVDENPGGLTREELNKRLAASNIPVYTLGCETNGNAPLLKDLYSISRQTGALSWSLTGLSDTLDVVSIMSGEEIPICAAVSIPEKLRDGGVKGIKLTFSDGSVAETQLTMPFGEVIETERPTDPAPAPAPEPETPVNPEPEPEPRNILPLLIVAGLLLLAVLGGVAFLLMRKRRESDRITPVSELIPPKTEETDILLDPSKKSGGAGTVILAEDDSRLMLSLTDRANPDRHFEVPLRGRVTIGRNNSNRIVLDYERSISGTHCEIFVEGDVFKLRDLNSSNGTYIDGVRVVDIAEVLNGSVIKLGRLEFVVGIR